MILTPHLLFGAAIASKIQNPIFAIVLAFLSHYLLDFIPHIEYSIENIENKKWKKAFPDIFKVFLDFCFGLLLILTFSNNDPIIFLGAFVAIISDGFSVLVSIVPNRALTAHNRAHQEKIHFFKNKKVSKLWRLTTQVLIVIISIILLKT